MFKKLLFFVWVAVLAGSAFGGTAMWTNDAADDPNWNNPDNWFIREPCDTDPALVQYPDRYPNNQIDTVDVNDVGAGNKCVIDAQHIGPTKRAWCKRLYVGSGTSPAGTAFLEMTGGLLRVWSGSEPSFVIGALSGGGQNGEVTMSGGTMKAGALMVCRRAAYGKFHMTGGIVQLGTSPLSENGRLTINYGTGQGYLDLYGGEIQCRALRILDGGHLDIEQGLMKLQAGDARSDVWGFINEGKITPYSNNPNGGGRGIFMRVDYNKPLATTYLRARLPDMNEPWEHYPQNWASDVNLFTDLCWTPGLGPNYTHEKYELYLGDDSVDVNDANHWDAGVWDSPPGVRVGELPNDVNSYDPNQWPYDPNGLRLGTTYYWRVDVNDEGTIHRGQTMRFTTETGLAGIWSPADEAGGLAHDGVILTWTPGNYATGHCVYLGTDSGAVGDANTIDTSIYPYVYRGWQAVDNNTYDPNTNPPDPNGLRLDTTYYWRIDEDNNDFNDFPGTVWSFSTRNYYILDDFESYANTTALRAVWTADGSAQLNLATANPNPEHSSTQHMNLDYYNMPGYDKYADAIYTMPAKAKDWTFAGALEVLYLWFKGDDNMLDGNGDPMMSIKVEDKDSHVATMGFNDPCQIDSEWHNWNIAFSDIKEENASCDVNYVSKVTIRIGDGSTETLGDAYFDDIRLYAFRCRPGILKPAADFDNNCTVTAGDVQLFGENWLETDYFIADTCEPSDANLKLWYKMDYTDDHMGPGPIGDQIEQCDDAITQPLLAGEEQDANGWMFQFDGQAPDGPQDGNSHWVNDVDRGRVLWSRQKEREDLQDDHWRTTNSIVVNETAANLFYTFQDKTISVWVKMLKPGDRLDYTSNDKYIFGTTYTWCIALKTELDNFCAVFGPQVGTGDSEPNAFGHTAIKRDVWTHLALVAENDNSGPCGAAACTVRFYVNGRLRAVEPGRDRQDGAFYPTYTPHIANAGGFTYKGSYLHGAPECYIDDFRLYTAVLNEAEVAYLAADGEPDLYVPLDIEQNMKTKVGDQGVYNPANLDIVDFNDFSALAYMWLHKQYWPPAGKYELPDWWPLP